MALDIDTIPSGGRDDARQDTPRTDASARPEAREQPSRDPRVITDADRAANPLGTAKREREQRERDEAGRFATPKGKDEPQRKPESDDGDKPGEPQGERQQSQQVPAGAIKAERDKRQASEREAEQLRREIAELRGMVMGGRQQQPVTEQPKGPEFWTAPEDFIRAQAEERARGFVDPVRQQLDAQRVHFSKQFAVQQHGQQAFDDAARALSELKHADPGFYARFEAQVSQSMDPVGDVVRWHKQQVAQREIGDDPAAYRERLRKEIMAELQGDGGDDEPRQQTPPAAQRQPVMPDRMPRSFAAERGGGSRGGSAYGGPRSLDTIMGR